MTNTIDFESKRKREYCASLALKCIFDFGFVWVISFLLFDASIFNALLFTLILWVGEFILMIKEAVYFWIIYKMRGKKATSDSILELLEKSSFPPANPTSFYTNGETYLEEVAVNDKVAVDTRLVSTFILGALANYTAIGAVLRGFFYRISLEDAISQYSKKFSEKKLSEIP